MTGDFDVEKFKKLADAHKPKYTAKRLSQELLKYGFDISDESIKKYRQGKAMPRHSVIYAFSKIFNVHLFDLLEGLEAPQISQEDKEFLEKLHSLKNSDQLMIKAMIQRMLDD